MKTIVALVDLSDESSKVVKHAHIMASAFGSELILMHVVPPEFPVVAYGGEVPPIPLAPSPEAIRADEARLEELMQPMKKLGVNVRTQQFKGPLAETVLAETKRLNADLVIMGSHHHSALYHLFVGSITTDVLKHASFPVLVVPCDAPAEK